MNKIRYTDKRKPGGLDGKERINIASRKGQYSNNFDIFDTSLQDIVNLAGKVTKVGEVTYSDLNLLGSSTSLEVVFSGGKPVGNLFIKGYAVITTAFSNQVYGYDYGYASYSNNKINNVEITVEGDSTTNFPNNAAQDIVVTITLNSANLQDWDAGVLEVYMESKTYPILA
jgi:hypothetical protein